MSMWTHITGVIRVDAIGRTQAEKEYILKTILDHLPNVTGSEGGMNTYLVVTNGHNESCSADEFSQFSNKSRHFEQQSNYIIAVDGDLRDRYFDETFAEFNKWLCRLAKRADIREVCVRLYQECGKEYIFTDRNGVYSDMFEYPSWSNGSGEPAWWEYLMWQVDQQTGLPRLLEYKYYNDKENDKKVEAWISREENEYEKE